MRIVLFALATLAACDAAQRPPEPDAWAGVKVTGCDDPTMWPATPLALGSTSTWVTGGPCSGSAQYPLTTASVGWWSDDESEVDERVRIDRTCWRVTSASPGSGWNVGDTFDGDRDGAHITVTGVDSRLLVEGRALRDDGTIVFSLAPDEIQLRNGRLLDEDAALTTAVVSPGSWTERTVVHAYGKEAVTDEILDAVGFTFGGDDAPRPRSIAAGPASSNAAGSRRAVS